MNDTRQMPNKAWNGEFLSFFVGCQGNRPLLAGGLTPGIKQKSHIWLSHVASVVMVKQQDDDKKLLKLAAAEKLSFFKKLKFD
jgi:hypothetical protein